MHPCLSWAYTVPSLQGDDFMMTQEQALPDPAGETGTANLLAVYRVRNGWLALAAIATVLTVLFAISSINGLQASPVAAAGPHAAVPHPDPTQFLSTRDYLRSSEMLYKWVLTGAALVLGALEISLAISLYLRNLRAGKISPMPGRRRVPNILRGADRHYIQDQWASEAATAYLVLSGLALGSLVIAGFLAFDSATWILAAMLSRNW